MSESLRGVVAVLALLLATAIFFTFERGQADRHSPADATVNSIAVNAEEGLSPSQRADRDQQTHSARDGSPNASAQEPTGGWVSWLIKLGLFLTLLWWLIRWMARWLTGKSDKTASHDTGASRMDAELGKTFLRPPSHIDDLTQIEGIDEATAKQLNAAGIYQFVQLKCMTSNQRQALKRKFNLTSTELALTSTGKKSTTDLTLESKSKSKSKSKNDAHHDAKTNRGPSAAGAGGVSKKMPPATDSMRLSGGDRKSDPDLGELFVRPPADRDDLTKLAGIDKETASRMNAVGIYRFDQINDLTPHQQAALKLRFDLPTEDVAKWKLAIPSLGAATAAIGSAAFSAAGGAKGMTEAVGGAAASAFAASSAVEKTSPQPSTNEPAHVKKAEATLETGPRSYDANTVLPGTRSDRRKKSGQDDASDESTGESIVADNWDSSTRIDLDFGEVFVHPPKQRQDLTQLAGVDNAVAAKMNAAGIYRYNQLLALSPRQQASFKRRFGIAYGDWESAIKVLDASRSTTTEQNDDAKGQGAAGSKARRPIGFAAPSPPDSNRRRTQQSRVLGAKDTARIDPDLGLLYTSTPADVDDLTRLAGIDSETAARMNAVGIFRFHQLSRLNDDQQSQLANRCNLGEIDFADWSRFMYAWGRGIDTTSAPEPTYSAAQLHGVSLPPIADGVFDGEKLVAYAEQVIFRGDNADSWGRGVDRPPSGGSISLPCDAIRSDINYLRFRRTDTRESVVVSMTKSQLFASGGTASGWNGSAESFYGGRHLGVYARDVPQEVETKFEQGGWGFGHRYGHNDRQDWGWAGQAIPPTTFEISVGRIGQTPGSIVFRSSDPRMWNTRSRGGDSQFADPISSVQHPIRFVRIMRASTGESVIVNVKSVLEESQDGRCGWNGSNAHFTGGNHLGVYHVDLPQEVETRFGFGGWGFGHPFNDNDRQAWAWAGRSLPPTVFEISVLESVPEFLRDEII